MENIINGQQAVLKKNTSFEYISENSMFTGSDSYTLTITFPLKDCPQNIRIFGHIHRQDVLKSKVTFDCEIRDKTFYKTGSITVTQISEVEVKTQFLEGRSEQNFDDTFDTIYLNQLNLGYPEASKRVKANNAPYTVLGFDSENPTYVALPWVNNTTGNLQNGMKCDINSTYNEWMDTRTEITFQPFLLYILNKVCEQVGYTGDFSAIKNTVYRYLLICNTLPATWGAHNFAIALPHWTLTEFFEQLELFLAGQFTINHKAKTISFQFNKAIAASTKDVMIDKVVNKYNVEVSKDNKSDYLGNSNLVYADNDNRLWAYRSCQWYIDEHKDEAMVFQNMPELLAFAKTLEKCGVTTTTTGRRTSTSYSRGYPRGSDGHKLFYVIDEDEYFIMWCYKAELVKSFNYSRDDTTFNYYEYTNRLEAVNQFGRRVVDKDADDMELNIVPAWIDETDDELGPCLFLECGEMGSAVSWTDETDENGNTTGGVSTSGGVNYGGTRSGSFGGSRSGSTTEYDDTDYNNGAFAQGRTAKAIAKGEQDKNDAYFDCIYMGYWDIEIRGFGYLPRPCIDGYEVVRGFYFVFSPYSMRLKDIGGAVSGLVPNIDAKMKYTFSFLADEIPDPRAVFYIEGGKYVCEKLACTFHESTGRSDLIKGDFYRIIGD